MSHPGLKIVFHGQNAANFSHGFEALTPAEHRIVRLPDALDSDAAQADWQSADVIVGVSLHAQMPVPLKARLFQAPAAGTDGIDASLLPAHTALCNCFGHENAIAEYVMAALLMRHVPLAQADTDLRQGRWTFHAGRPTAQRTELGMQTLGLVGWGHIAQTLAQRAKAFGMRVHVANRSAVQSPWVDRSWPLTALNDFMGCADAIVVTLPLADNTRGLVDAKALAAMRSDGVLVNVGRGAVIDESALYQALHRRAIGGAVIDTWYQYPTPTQAQCAPSAYDFAALDNVLMTPHMSGWTQGTVVRRQHTVADNIARLLRGDSLLNLLKAPT